MAYPRRRWSPPPPPLHARHGPVPRPRSPDIVRLLMDIKNMQRTQATAMRELRMQQAAIRRAVESMQVDPGRWVKPLTPAPDDMTDVHLVPCDMCARDPPAPAPVPLACFRPPPEIDDEGVEVDYEDYEDHADHHPRMAPRFSVPDCPAEDYMLSDPD